MNRSDMTTYNDVALTVNAPIYAYYAERILEKTGIREGVCLDVGCGGGYLGLALANITGLEFLFLDYSAEMLQHAAENIRTCNLEGRARIIRAAVQEIPLEDDTVDLVISRGSLPFWGELGAAFGEIRRVLKKDGHAYIGGGLGPAEMRERLQQELRAYNPDWFEQHRKPPVKINGQYRDGLVSAGIRSFTITRSDVGTWVEFRGA